ncbi:MAG: hypothetical protein NC209_04875 [Alistipes sp.]|nr:hypothetical protein [Alistipes senegalensis]MCM1250459.1 hypothetical protein [Alistipes sp.]
MKTLSVLATMVATLLCVSCGTTKPATVASNTRPGSPFGDVYEVPAAEHDTDDYFGATGIATGPKARMDVLQMSALTNAQNIVRQKMQHAYKGAIDDYSSYIGNNAGSDAVNKVERAGTQIIDAIVNDTQATKGPMFSAVDEKGNVTCYVGIRVSKKVIAEKIADYVSEEEELKIRFKEEQFRQKMEENFKKFKEN